MSASRRDRPGFVRRCRPVPPIFAAPSLHPSYLADLRPPAFCGGNTLIHLYIYSRQQPRPPLILDDPCPLRCSAHVLELLYFERPPPFSVVALPRDITCQDIHTVGYHDICPPAVFAPVMVRYNIDRTYIPSDKHVSYIVLRARSGTAVFRAPPPPIFCVGVTSEYSRVY